MADHPLESRWNPRLYLLIHSRRALPTCAGCGLGVQVLGLIILALLLLLRLHHPHLLIVSRLSRIRRRCTLVVRRVHVVVHVRRLCVRSLPWVLIYLHIGICGALCSLLSLLLGLLLCYSSLLGLGTLFTHAFISLLLLDTRSRRPVRS